MMGRREIWEKLKDYVESPEICLFDIDLPSGSKGTLRVFIARRDRHSAGISVDECASVSKRISAAPEFDEMLHVFQLEVSSPGVNRRLRNPEHFAGAIGERIKVTTSGTGTGENDGGSLIGTLKGMADGHLVIAVDGQPGSVSVNLDKIKKARIDYIF